MTHGTLQKLEAFCSRDYTGLWVQSVYPSILVILRAGRCVDSVALTPREGEFLARALGATSTRQAIPVFIAALHHGYWPHAAPHGGARPLRPESAPAAVPVGA